MPGTAYVYETLIRENHLDSFGHVNNAMYLQLLEEARWEAISSRGYGMREVQNSQKGPVVLELSIQFRKELKLREKVKIDMLVTELRDRIWKMEQNIFNEKGEKSAIAQITMGYFDLKNRKLIPVEPAWLQAIGWTP